MSFARNCPKNFLGKPGHATEQCLNDDDFHGYDDVDDDDGHEDDDVDRKKGCWRLVSQWLPVQCFFLTPCAVQNIIIIILKNMMSMMSMIDVMTMMIDAILIFSHKCRTEREYNSVFLSITRQCDCLCVRIM